MVERVCAACSAGWVGYVDDGCGWCERRECQQRALERDLLLDPPWLRTSAGHPTYDALDDVGKAVWDRTRGQTRGHDSVVIWVARLARAVDVGVITQAEAERAIRRMATR
jgi:hypothetical protein